MNMGYALGGEVDAIDPVSGNEIPPDLQPKKYEMIYLLCYLKGSM